ncbi:MAG: Ig-like domain-containing protein [Pikeienuella sp.]|uniref:Ig-like domain-containing protein n=1 Tax=Pikeienuella sp. TaxID=2831957 RepID=UPI00391BEEE1
MTSAPALSAALGALFDELQARASTEFAGREAALIGALDPLLDGTAAPLEDLLAEIGAALDGVEAGPEDDLSALLAAALNGAGIEGVSATAGAGGVTIQLTAEREAPLGRTEAGALSGALGAGALGLALDGALDLTATAALDFAVFFDAETGALSLADTSSAADMRLSIGATLDPGSLSSELSLGPVSASAALAEGLNGAALDLTLDIDGGEIGALAPEATFGFDAGLAIALEAGFASPFLPSISGDLVIDYGGAGEGVIGGIEGVAVRGVSIGIDALDDLLGGVLGPLDNIVSAFPLGPVVRLLSRPLPLLDPLGETLPFLDVIEDGDVTLNDLLQLFANGETDFSFIEVVADVALALQTISDLASGAAFEVGDIEFSAEALDALAGGGTGAGIGSAFDFDGFDPSLLPGDLFGGLIGQVGALEGGGLSFPLLTSSAPELAGLILFSGFFEQPAPLVEFILPEFGLDREQASFFFSIPVGPFAAVIEGGFQADFRIGAGISTRGLINGSANPADSLYLTTPMDGMGGRLPLAAFVADLGAGFGVSVPGLRVTVDGGILGEISAGLGDVNDENPGDGLTHVDSLALPCLFDELTGALDAGLRLTFSIGIRPFEWKRVVSIAEVEIANFAVNCSTAHGRDIPVIDDGGLATIGGPGTGVPEGELRLNMGEDRADLRNLPDAQDDDIDETFSVTRMTQPEEGEEQDPPFDPTRLQVNAFGVAELFDEAGLSTVRGDGGDGNDVLSLAPGIALVADFNGGDGDDILIGGDLDDLLEGGAGDDVINPGGGGSNTLNGGSGDDVIRAGIGADRIEGGVGYDQVDYSASEVGVTLIRQGGDVLGSGGLAEGDTLTNVEYLIGTRFDDVLSGDDGASSSLDGEEGDDQLIGGEGDDYLIGGAGADLMIGRGGRDLASYVNSFGGVSVDLASGLAFGADATGDLLDRIEGVQGSMEADSLSGDEGENLIDGFAGDDLLEGRGGQDDVRGGGGSDTIFALGDGDRLDGGGAIAGERDRDLLSYEKAGGPVIARLATALYSDGLENGDEIAGGLFRPDREARSPFQSSFEDLRGSDFGDDLGGDLGANRIEGGAGDDTIRAFAGDDTVAGGAGADMLEGDQGTDWLDYSASGAGVRVSLATPNPEGPPLPGSGQGGDAEGDVISGFENILGTRFADTLAGDDGNNVLDPGTVEFGLGPDRVSGGGGVDVLRLDYSALDVPVGFAILFDEGSETDGRAGFFPGGPASAVEFDGIERFEISGTLRGDVIVTGDFDDTIFGGGGGDVILAGLGDDIILAGEGDDLVFAQFEQGEPPGEVGGGGFFVIDGGLGVDGLSISLAEAPDAARLVFDAPEMQRFDQVLSFSSGGHVTGFEFIGTVVGTAFSDEFAQGGRINNDFRGGGGDDTLAPGLGFDLVLGGETPLDPADLTDADLLILDFSTDETGAGVITLAEGEGRGFQRNSAGGDAGQLLDFVSAIDIEYANIIGTAQNDVIRGFDDPFYDLQGDTLRGLDGDDLLEGFNGPDSLFGGAGSDTLIGGTGDDRLQGGLAGRVDGTDDLTAGAGADLFVLGDRTGLHYGEEFEGAGAPDLAVIRDFESGIDRIQLTGSADDYQLFGFGGQVGIFRVGDEATTLIARLDGFSGPLDLESDDFTYVTVTAGPGDIGSPGDGSGGGFGGPGGLAGAAAASATLSRGRTDFQTALSDMSPDRLRTLTVDDLSGGEGGGEGEGSTEGDFIVEQGFGATSLARLLVESLSAQGFIISESSFDTRREGDARGFGTFENAPALIEGIVLSIGIAEDLPGLNEEDGGIRSFLSGGRSVDLGFERIGQLNLDGSVTTFYRADLGAVPLPMRSLILRDDDDGVGGASGARSGADIAGIAITTADFDDIFALTGGDMAALNDPSILPRLDLLDFSPAGVKFTQGALRSFDPADEGTPGTVSEGPDAAGSRGGFVDEGAATLGRFDFNGETGFLSLGDGGALGLQFTDTLPADQPAWLIVAEAGGSERFEGRITASTEPLDPPGDLSTDFGAPGAADDRIAITVEFTVDFGAGGEGDAAPRFVRLLEAALASEEIREFSGTALQDSVSIRLNGHQAAYLSDGHAATLERLSPSAVGDVHPDLVLNLVDSQITGPGATRADAFSQAFSVEGFIVDGLNRLEIVLEDRRDGALDTALFLSAAEAPMAEPEGPLTLGFTVAEDGLLTGTLPGGAVFLPFDGGPSSGLLDLAPDGGFTYRPDADFAGEDSFVFGVEAEGETSFGRVVLTVVAAGDAPVAVDDMFETAANAAFVTGNVLANDFDPDAGDTILIVAADTSETRGLVTDNGDGTFAYDPNGAFDDLRAGQTATDSFFYTIRDGSGAESTAEVIVTITGVGDDDRPVIVGGPGGDRLVAPPGGAIIDGGAGRDVYVGGSGADTFVLGDGEGDQLRRFDASLDVLDVSAWGVQSFAELAIFDRVNAAQGATLVTILDAASGNMSFHHERGDRLSAADFTAENFIFAPVRNLTVTGTEPFGSETIYGRSGDDVIVNDSGLNTLFGQGGADRFVIREGAGGVIADFAAGEDVIDVSAWGLGGFDDLDISEAGGLITVRGEPGEIVRLRPFEGLSAADLTEDRFVFDALLTA